MATKHPSDDSAFLKKIGANISRLRKKAGISQEELADLAKIDRSYLGSVERGERNISAINIRKIAFSLKTQPQTLLK
jgi:transcriptional regulator with XRE-family HTH domain